MRRLRNGTHPDGDQETVDPSFDAEEAGGDGVVPADLAEATGLPVEQATALLDDLVAQDVLATTAVPDEVYGGARCVRSRAV